MLYRQAGHGRRVAQAHYAIDGAFLHRLGPELITAYEQASMAWHGLLRLDRTSTVAVGHRRDASQQLTSRPSKKGRTEDTDRALEGLRRIYHSPKAQPRSEGQAAALELVHHPSPHIPLIVVLPTSSGKSVLFFSVAAMTSQQTVIVVVPFAVLVDDIVVRGQAAGLTCEEWLDETSGHELQQLIVVSADRAVRREFLHYAKGKELKGELAHVFFDECHVAFTDTSYRERLRELWTLRYLECPFTGLTATLIVQLEPVLKERLSIDNAVVFRRSTARRTIRYQVIDSREEPPSVVGTKFVQQLSLPTGKRGVVYVRSYTTGTIISTALQCPFYKACADDKGALLQEWSQGPGGWIVATGALGTGINIEGIVYIVHVDRPYGLTSFVQQSGRGGRNGEVSDSVIIARVVNSHGQKRSGIMSEYSVEQIDEDAMTEFIQARTCRRQVLSRYFDQGIDRTDCHSTDSIFCDQCKTSNRPREAGINARFHRTVGREEEAQGEEGIQADTEEGKGVEVIAQRLRALQESYESMIAVMDRLQGECIYCALSMKGERLHAYSKCTKAKAEQCEFAAYQQWRKGIDFGQAKHCWECGLSQYVCRRLEGQPNQQVACEYPEIMLPSIFILQQQQHLPKIVQAAGFQGEYDSEDLWEWLNRTAEGFGREWDSNWTETWITICEKYVKIARAANAE